MKSRSKIQIGVLALQGDFREHLQKFRELGVTAKEIRRSEALDSIDALVLPGGESTAIAILESAESRFSMDHKSNPKTIFDAIKSKHEKGLPIWGTCMGSILLSKEIEGSTQGRLALMDIKVRRNAFGPQRFSSEVPVKIKAIGPVPFPAVFIRAPVILEAGSTVEVLGSVPEGIVIARQHNLLASVFHPEAVDDTRIHELFLDMI